MSTVRMQGLRKLGELARVCGAATHPPAAASIKKTPRTGRGGLITFSVQPASQVLAAYLCQASQAGLASL